MTGGEGEVRRPPKSERGESELERGADAASEAGHASPVRDETGQEAFEPSERGEDVYVRRTYPVLRDRYQPKRRRA